MSYYIGKTKEGKREAFVSQSLPTELHAELYVCFAGPFKQRNTIKNITEENIVWRTDFLPAQKDVYVGKAEYKRDAYIDIMGRYYTGKTKEGKREVFTSTSSPTEWYNKLYVCFAGPFSTEHTAKHIADESIVWRNDFIPLQCKKEVKEKEKVTEVASIHLFRESTGLAYCGNRYSLSITTKQEDVTCKNCLGVLYPGFIPRTGNKDRSMFRLVPRQSVRTCETLTCKHVASYGDSLCFSCRNAFVKNPKKNPFERW